MEGKSESAKAVEYVRWVYPVPRAVAGYGILVPGSVHRVADLPGDPLRLLGVMFEPAEGPEAPDTEREEPNVLGVKHGGEHE